MATVRTEPNIAPLDKHVAGEEVSLKEWASLLTPSAREKVARATKEVLRTAMSRLRATDPGLELAFEAADIGGLAMLLYWLDEAGKVSE